MVAPQRRIAVVGAGMVGLATAWFLQEREACVTVFERSRVGSGASWGNAGWLTPSRATPLPDPAMLRYAIRALFVRSSPVKVACDPRLVPFLLRMVRQSTTRRWEKSMAALAPLNVVALDAFDALASGGVEAGTKQAEPFLACFRAEREAWILLRQLEKVQAAGATVKADLVVGAEARCAEPALSDDIDAVVRVHGQRYINPPQFVASLAAAVRSRGGDVREGVPVTDVRDLGARVEVATSQGIETFETIVLATGAWLPRLATPFGVQPVQAGRGYSFSVVSDPMPRGPLYFPTQRVACTPLGDRLRVTGIMEIRHVDAPPDPRNFRTVASSVRDLLPYANFDARQDEWMGPRPLTADGLPLVGRTTSPRVYVAGGHGMWGIMLGPLTGQVLAEAIMEGASPPALAVLDPLR